MRRPCAILSSALAACWFACIRTCSVKAETRVRTVFTVFKGASIGGIDAWNGPEDIKSGGAWQNTAAALCGGVPRLTRIHSPWAKTAKRGCMRSVRRGCSQSGGTLDHSGSGSGCGYPALVCINTDAGPDDETTIHHVWLLDPLRQPTQLHVEEVGICARGNWLSCASFTI